MAINSFKPALRDVVEEMCYGIEDAIAQVEDQEEKYTAFYPYSYDVKELTRLLDNFANENPDIASANIALANPGAFQDGETVRIGISMQTKLEQLAEIFDDFINFTGRGFLSFKYKKDKHKYFLDSWSKFETEFFSDEVTINFRAFVWYFWFDSGGVLENLINEPGLSIHWRGREADSQTIFHIMQKAQNSQTGNLKEYPSMHSETPHYVLDLELRMKKNLRIEAAFSQARDKFEKVCFLFRQISKGGAHISCVTADLLGNRMNSCDFSVYNPLNQLFCPLDTSRFSYPDDVLFQTAWQNLAGRKIDEFRFQNQKHRDYAQNLDKKHNFRYGKQYDLSIKLEKILDLVQIIESTIGDFGISNGEYINKMFDRQLEQKFKTLIGLRHKYVHGKPSEIDHVIANDYASNLDLLEEDINILFHFTLMVVIKAVNNPDIKAKLEKYHLGKGRAAYINGRLQKGARVPGIQFPSLV